MKDKIKQGIKRGLELTELRGIIIAFKNEGGSQKSAQIILNELRQDYIKNEHNEDIVLELLDFVTGFCIKERAIWQKEWEAEAKRYDDLDWPFSSAHSWSKVVEQNSKNSNLIYYSNQLRLCGNFKKALEVINEVDANKFSEDVLFYYHSQLGMIYYDLWDLENAIKYFNLSIKNNPNETYPYVFLATLLMKKNRIEEAKNHLEFALTKEGDIDEVNYNLSLLYAGTGDYDKAIGLMEECIKIDINFPDAKVLLKDLKNMKEIKFD